MPCDVGFLLTCRAAVGTLTLDPGQCVSAGWVGPRRRGGRPMGIGPALSHFKAATFPPQFSSAFRPIKSKLPKNDLDTVLRLG
jgi:hypothetical protein